MVHVINYFYYNLFFIVACFLITNTYRILGNRKNVGQDPLYLIGILFGIVNGSVQPDLYGDILWINLISKF